MFPLLYWDANREWVTLFAGGCNQQPEMHMMAEGTRYLATSRYLAKSPILPLFWGTGFPCMMNFIAYKHDQERRIGCPSSQDWKGNITRKQHILRTETNHNKSYFPWHVSLQSNDRWNPACWFNKPCEIAIFGEVPKGSELIGGYYCNYRPKVADTYRIITVIIIIISYDWLMDYILRLVIG